MQTYFLYICIEGCWPELLGFCGRHCKPVTVACQPWLVSVHILVVCNSCVVCMHTSRCGCATRLFQSCVIQWLIELTQEYL